MTHQHGQLPIYGQLTRGFINIFTFINIIHTSLRSSGKKKWTLCHKTHCQKLKISEPLSLSLSSVLGLDSHFSKNLKHCMCFRRMACWNKGQGMKTTPTKMQKFSPHMEVKDALINSIFGFKKIKGIP